jgi:hypothetical protein
MKKWYNGSPGSKAFTGQSPSAMGRLIECPYCHQAFSKTDIGFRSHMRNKHVPDGTVKAEDVGHIVLELLGKHIRDERKDPEE